MRASPAIAAVAVTVAVAIAVALPILVGHPARAQIRPAAPPPVVIRFTPSGGPPGTHVVLSGEHFAPDLHVSYGGRPLALLGHPAADSVELAIPTDAAASAPFVVVTRAGSTQSGGWFRLELPATVESMTPTSGPPGTRVSLRGSGFHGDERWLAGTTELQVVERQRLGVVLEAPARPGGPLKMISAGKTVALPFRFDVTAGLAITSFSPSAGPPGTRVTLRGPALGTADLVRYGGLPCPTRQRGDDLLVVEVPASATGEDRFSVEAAGQHADASDPYRVVAPPRP
jgi:hypothetical protein